jgi:hypothetical protein
MVKCCVFFAVWTKFLNIIWTSFGFKGLSWRKPQQIFQASRCAGQHSNLLNRQRCAHSPQTGVWSKTSPKPLNSSYYGSNTVSKSCTDKYSCQLHLAVTPSGFPVYKTDCRDQTVCIIRLFGYHSVTQRCSRCTEHCCCFSEDTGRTWCKVETMWVISNL